MRIYSYYSVINGPKITFYHHLIHTFDFTELDGKEKWTAYKFTKNIYKVWMLTYFKRLYLIINKLFSDLDFKVLQQSELQFPENSGFL